MRGGEIARQDERLQSSHEQAVSICDYPNAGTGGVVVHELGRGLRHLQKVGLRFWIIYNSSVEGASPSFVGRSTLWKFEGFGRWCGLGLNAESLLLRIEGFGLPASHGDVRGFGM